ncbi:DUF1330 domain-containing protein [Leeia sp. TBRC 13508]|uniref:DUF1330 domain-containing protein n=1 Tax=Leeia speluncae TaxID=2884804 RepID=A0ABS8D600_9NEIS|nr:DUF1330 domain-containing protein [Leeia speluncae]MCB6183048.1 DUF1330 domain-containing protein [Leeia speluncae]
MSTQPAYFLFNVTDVHDPIAFVPYQEKVVSTILQYHGQIVVADGEREGVEGTPFVGKVYLLRFASKAAAKTWYHSPEYQAIIQHRFAAATCHASLLEGVA